MSGCRGERPGSAPGGLRPLWCVRLLRERAPMRSSAVRRVLRAYQSATRAPGIPAGWGIWDPKTAGEGPPNGGGPETGASSSRPGGQVLVSVADRDHAVRGESAPSIWTWYGARADSTSDASCRESSTIKRSISKTQRSGRCLRRALVRLRPLWCVRPLPGAGGHEVIGCSPCTTRVSERDSSALHTRGLGNLRPENGGERPPERGGPEWGERSGPRHGVPELATCFGALLLGADLIPLVVGPAFRPAVRCCCRSASRCSPIPRAAWVGSWP